MPNLFIDLPTHQEQVAFNLERWADLIVDQELARFSGRVETDRHGHILMSPPASSEHGRFQSEIPYLLRTLLPGGKTYAECPISTPDGVRVADAAWISAERLSEIGRKVCLVKAPEICVEIISPGNSKRELEEKRALYFAAGADEVWFCAVDGAMTFFAGPESDGTQASRLCPEFPRRVQT